MPYSGVVQDFSQIDLGKFVFAEQTLGVDANLATIIQGDDTGVTRNLNVSVSADLITVPFKDTGSATEVGDGLLPYEQGGADQGAYLVEYLDASSSSLDFTAADPIIGALVNQGETEARFSLADDPDQINLSVSLGDARQGNKSMDEPRRAVRLILQKQSNGNYLANGAVAFTGLDDTTGSRLVTYAIDDYIVGTPLVNQ